MSRLTTLGRRYIYRYWLDSGDREVVSEPLPWGQWQATAGPQGRYAHAPHGGDCDNIRSVMVFP